MNHLYKITTDLVGKYSLFYVIGKDPTNACDKIKQFLKNTVFKNFAEHRICQIETITDIATEDNTSNSFQQVLII